MKKLIISAVTAMSIAFSVHAIPYIKPPVIKPVTTNTTEIVVPTVENVDVYTFKMAAKVPYLKNGIRQYSSQNLNGYLTMVFDTEGQVMKCYAEVQNSKTKVNHLIMFQTEVFNRIGKSSKYTTHTVPVVAFNGCEILDNNEQGHEYISDIALVGSGALKNLKLKSCTACGGSTEEYYTRVQKMNGSFVGLMDCMCEDDDPSWDHTVVAVHDGATDERAHLAPVWGTWTATYNDKLSN